MSIWGIIIGGTAGFALGGPIGGLLGAVAGHAVESKFIPTRPDPQATKRIAFTVAVIALSAKMAKASHKKGAAPSCSCFAACNSGATQLQLSELQLSCA